MGDGLGHGVPNPGAPTGFNNACRDYSRVLEFDPTTLEIVWQYTPLEAGLVIPETAYNFYGPTISGMQRLPNGNTLICEGDYGRLFEVTREHETVWEYQNPHAMAYMGGITWIYRAYRAPYEWVPQVEKPEEEAIALIENSKFRVPGSPQGKAGKVTQIKTGPRSL